MQLDKKIVKNVVISGFITIFMIFLDQITKWLAVVNLKDKPAFVIWKDVFELHYLENQSAAFGVDFLSIIQRIFQFQYFIDHPDVFLKVRMAFFTVLTILVVILFIVMYFKIPWNKHFMWLKVILLLFVAGAIGNLIDRMCQNYVVDFFYFKLINFPIFNVADIYVTVAAIMFIVLCLFYYKEEDFEFLFPDKGKKCNKKKDN